ncbi:MAG: hypothetical protein PHH96_02220 [Smithellaceae bacterium]|jgi:hypothetical protein|nr:hypothetical protein [Smithellaceae bacterium]MDD5413617.1 hypothetical protein [Smithellaceae bacterium]
MKENHKCIILKNDKIFRHVVEYHDAVKYPGAVYPYKEKEDEMQKYKAEDVLKAIYHLGVLGKIDATDLKIIAARDCSPIPSMRAIAKELKISLGCLQYRIQRIKRLIIKDIPSV